MIIDTHAHVWSDDAATYPFRPILAHVPPPTRPAPIEMLIEDMDRAGVRRVVLVQPSVYGWDNRYLMDCLARWPERFSGICLIDPRSADPASDLARWCGPGGCMGLRFNIIRQGDAGWMLDDARRPLFAAIEAFGLNLSFHMDIAQAPVIAALAVRHPATSFIVDYLGGEVHRDPAAGGHLDALAARPNVAFKLLCVAEDARTPYPFPDIVPFYRQVLERFGAARVMYGSDYPGVRTICSYEQAVDWGREFPGLSENERGLVMSGTAQRLLRL